MLRGRKIVITGGAGFIGSSLARALAPRNEVTVLDDVSTGKTANLDGIDGNIELVRGSVTDLKLLKKTFHGKELVFHMAAQASVAASMADPVYTHEANVTGTLNVLLSAKDNGVSRVVYSSSSAVYGNEPTLPKKESMLPEPISPYGASKVAGEHYCRAFADSFGLYTVSLRYFNVYGPRQNPKSDYAAVIPRFITNSLNGKPLIIFGDGEQTRDFSFVDDVVRANILAAEGRKANGAVINIANGTKTTVNRLASLILAETGSSAPILHKPVRKGDITHSVADITLARKLIGFEPEYELERGLGLAVKFFKKHA
jgi:UDP-glucose 4-epimerase